MGIGAGDWRLLINEPQCMDCLDLMHLLPNGMVNLCFADPLYNIGKAAWDKIDGYLEWCEQWIAEASRVLAPNGAFWVSHSEPLVLADLSKIISKYGRGLVNWVTWDKYNGNPTHQCGAGGGGPMVGMTLCGGLRSFQPMTEYLVWHTDEGDWTAQCDRERGFIFEPIRAYLAGERDRAGWTTRRVAEEFQKKTGSRTVTGMAGHWLEQVQWVLPTAENYQWLRELFNSHDHGGEYLRRDYEYLRRDYEDLRYTFHNPGKVSSVWQIPPAPRTWHPTPKPEALLERIILATSNEGDIVLDPFAGSFTTARVAQHLSRQWICGDNCAEYVKRARVELAQPQQVALEGIA